MGKPCRVTFGERVFFKPDFVKRFLDTLHLEDSVVEESKYLKSIGYDNAFNEGDPLLIREKKAEAKAEAKEQAKEEKKVEPSIDNVAQKAGILPKNIRDLYKVNRELFSLNQVKALASAVAMDRMIGVMAKRAGVPKTEMYGRLKFEKASEQDLPQGVKMQVDAWHGSPYEFDKFQTAFMGKGEGAQAFGWGLYFTDLESIARDYAEKLSKPNFNKFREKLLKDNPSRDVINDILDFSESYGYNYNKVLDALTKNENKAAVDYLKENKDLFNSVERNLYKVSLNKGKSPDQYNLLEWDKPVSDEVKAKVKEEFTKLGISTIRDGYTSTSYINGEPVVEVVPPKDALDGEFLGKELYEFIALKFEGSYNEIQKEASLLLLRAGVDGIKYPAESIARGATSETTRGFNYVVFDENAVSIEEVIKFQKDAEKARGAMMITLDGQATIYALTDPNVSTPLHELAHVFEHYLTDGEKKAVMDAANTKEWNTKTSEYFARGFEKYLAEGKSPIAALDKIFAKFKEWLTDIYNGILGSDIDIELNDKMRNIYAQMLGKEIANKPASKKTSIFDDFDASRVGGAKAKQIAANRAFAKKHGKDAAVAKAISSNFEAIADELKAKGIFTKIEC